MELTRKELYDLVWSEPMTTICKRFGLSDNGLRKRCKSMNIPTTFGVLGKTEIWSSEDVTCLPYFSFAQYPKGGVGIFIDLQRFLDHYLKTKTFYIWLSLAQTILKFI